MLNDLILNEKTLGQIKSYLERPSHALLLAGPIGVGLGTIAKSIASQLAPQRNVTITPQIHDKQKTKIINIDDVHEIGKLVALREKDAFAIIIDDAEMMHDQAQQAFLKMLEEPIESIFYIMTTHNQAKLRQTILSRLQTIAVIPPKRKQTDVLLPDLDREKATKIKFLANQKPAEIKRLIDDEEYFNAKSLYIEKAKAFLQSETYERLIMISDFKDRTDAKHLCVSIAHILLLVVSGANSAKIAKQLDLISQSIDNISQNGNVRVQLLNLALNL